MSCLRIFVLPAVIAAFVLPMCAQQLGRDPLNDKEADQLRDWAQMPNHRLKGYVGFLRTRMTEIETLRADPKATNRGRRIHDLLQEIATLSDELSDNMDRFSSEKWDIRKCLKDVIEGQNEIYLKLRAMSDARPTDPKLQEEVDEYRFALKDAIESLKSAIDASRQTTLEQARAAKDKALKKPDE